MGLGKEWPWAFGIALFASVALGVAAFAFGSGTTSVTMVSVALIGLALAQIIAAIRSTVVASQAEDAKSNQISIAKAMSSIVSEQRRLSDESSQYTNSLAEFRSETQMLNTGVTQGLGELRRSHTQLADNLKSILDTQRDIQQNLSEAPKLRQAAITEAMEREQQWMSQLVGAHVPPAAEQPSYAPPLPMQQTSAIAEPSVLDSLTISLEPIVDLFTSSTAHYRMLPGMVNDQGNDVTHEIFLRHVEHIGQRDGLDVHIVEHTLELLEQLRQRDPSLCIFVPIGAATLSSSIAVQTILSMLRNAPNLLQGVVLDVTHSVLASLPEASLEGLATLARAGVPLSLSQASIAGVDLAALSNLNVRFISMTAASLGLNGQVSLGLPGFVQSARALRIHVVVSQVTDPAQVANLSRTARYASGPAFAMPRRLKRVAPEAAPLYAAA
jgi:EAL domain-containing protein (putative c-di-GMP-specific phosphodiesterase class I)